MRVSRIQKDERIEKITDENLDHILSERGVVIIDCWAPWCRTCKDFGPVFDEAAKRYPNHTFAKLNTGEQEDLTRRLAVAYVPTLIVFRDGIMVFREPGYLDQSGLDDVIAQAEALDMEVVKKTVEARSA